MEEVRESKGGGASAAWDSAVAWRQAAVAWLRRVRAARCRATMEGDGVGAMRDDAADRWARMRRGSGHPRLSGGRGSAVLTSGAGSTVHRIRFSNRIKFISNGFKFAPNFD
jgi:hypothetical protein